MAHVHHWNRRSNWWSQDSLPWGNCCFLKRDHEAEWLEWSSLEDLNPCCWELLQKDAATGPVRAEGDFLSHLLPDPLLARGCWYWDACSPDLPWGWFLTCSSLSLLTGVVCWLYAINQVIHELLIGYCSVYLQSLPLLLGPAANKIPKGFLYAAILEHWTRPGEMHGVLAFEDVEKYQCKKGWQQPFALDFKIEIQSTWPVLC